MRNPGLIDGTKVLCASGINMPNEIIFLTYGVELQKPVVYQRLEFGITANGRDGHAEPLLEEVVVSVNSLSQDLAC